MSKTILMIWLKPLTPVWQWSMLTFINITFTEDESERSSLIQCFHQPFGIVKSTNDLLRTTNLLKGFHNKLNHFCETSHLNLFFFISKIQDIEQDGLLDCLLALTGHLTRAKNLKQVKLDKRIKDTVAQYDLYNYYF